MRSAVNREQRLASKPAASGGNGAKRKKSDPNIPSSGDKEACYTKLFEVVEVLRSKGYIATTSYDQMVSKGGSRVGRRCCELCPANYDNNLSAKYFSAQTLACDCVTSSIEVFEFSPDGKRLYSEGCSTCDEKMGDDEEDEEEEDDRMLDAEGGSEREEEEGCGCGKPNHLLQLTKTLAKIYSTKKNGVSFLIFQRGEETFSGVKVDNLGLANFCSKSLKILNAGSGEAHRTSDDVQRIVEVVEGFFGCFHFLHFSCHVMIESRLDMLGIDFEEEKRKQFEEALAWVNEERDGK
jgi:hypothetical protein